MDISILLLANGFLLAIILVVLMILLSFKAPPKEVVVNRSRVKSDLKKIKQQVEDN